MPSLLTLTAFLLRKERGGGLIKIFKLQTGGLFEGGLTRAFTVTFRDCVLTMFTACEHGKRGVTVRVSTRLGNPYKSWCFILIPQDLVGIETQSNSRNIVLLS